MNAVSPSMASQSCEAMVHAPPETGLPTVDDPARIAPGDARELTKLFLDRLQHLEEGTPAYQYVRNTLIELSLPLVHFVARRFHRRTEQAEDVVQVGTIGLIKAIDRFDVGREVAFNSYAVPYITGEIKRFFRDTTWDVHVPRRLQEQRAALSRATERLEARLGRAPSTAELAQDMDLSVGDVVETQTAANAYTAHSLDTPAQGDDAHDGDGSSLVDRLGARDPELEKVENLCALKPLLDELEARDRRLLELYFGEELTQQQVGAELGISQMQVSRLLNRCLTRLRTAMTQD